MTPAKIWQLSKAWYHNRLSLEYHGRTLAEVQEIFRQLDLTSAFWQRRAREEAPPN
jgi:hypothetical protein